MQLSFLCTQDLARLLKTVTQRATHFPREAVRALFAEDLRSRVYLKRPTKYFLAESAQNPLFTYDSPSTQAPKRWPRHHSWREILGVSPDFHRVSRAPHGRARIRSAGQGDCGGQTARPLQRDQEEVKKGAAGSQSFPKESFWFPLFINYFS